VKKNTYLKFCKVKILSNIETLEENHNRRLDFWINLQDRTDYRHPVHLGRVRTRLIWVERYEKTSHWRFVTTKKKIKLKRDSLQIPLFF
jgi:hypothetical protein